MSISTLGLTQGLNDAAQGYQSGYLGALGTLASRRLAQQKQDADTLEKTAQAGYYGGRNQATTDAAAARADAMQKVAGIKAGTVQAQMRDKALSQLPQKLNDLYYQDPALAREYTKNYDAQNGSNFTDALFPSAPAGLPASASMAPGLPAPAGQPSAAGLPSPGLPAPGLPALPSTAGPAAPTSLPPVSGFPAASGLPPAPMMPSALPMPTGQPQAPPVPMQGQPTGSPLTLTKDDVMQHLGDAGLMVKGGQFYDTRTQAPVPQPQAMERLAVARNAPGSVSTPGGLPPPAGLPAPGLPLVNPLRQPPLEAAKINGINAKTTDTQNKSQTAFLSMMGTLAPALRPAAATDFNQRNGTHYPVPTLPALPTVAAGPNAGQPAQGPPTRGQDPYAPNLLQQSTIGKNAAQVKLDGTLASTATGGLAVKQLTLAEQTRVNSRKLDLMKQGLDNSAAQAQARLELERGQLGLSVLKAQGGLPGGTKARNASTAAQDALTAKLNQRLTALTTPGKPDMFGKASDPLVTLNANGNPSGPGAHEYHQIQAMLRSGSSQPSPAHANGGIPGGGEMITIGGRTASRAAWAAEAARRGKR